MQLNGGIKTRRKNKQKYQITKKEPIKWRFVFLNHFIARISENEDMFH